MNFISSLQNYWLLRAERIIIYIAVEFITLMSVEKTTECELINRTVVVRSS
jgi:hypothetical protein